MSSNTKFKELISQYSILSILSLEMQSPDNSAMNQDIYRAENPPDQRGINENYRGNSSGKIIIFLEYFSLFITITISI
jgi:hypothetical protein